MSKNTIWIDLDNSPHVLFFNPVIKELERLGYDVVVTARDYAQVFELAELFKIDVKKIGKHYGKNKLFKVIGFLIRSFQLLPFIFKNKPRLALSHGSRSQLFIAKLCGVPSVMAADYEHTQGIPFFAPELMLVPNILSMSSPHNCAGRIATYPGIKEDVYVQDFKPDFSSFNRIGIDGNRIIVTIRPPATLAHYHTKKSDELFHSVIDYLGRNDSIQMIVVPRTKDQELDIKEHWSDLVKSKKIIIPDHVINGLDLVWYSDLVISAGGTMIRESAALGVPSYSIFGGKLGAVDRYLSDSGRLTLIGCRDEISTKILLRKREKTNDCIKRNPHVLNSIIENIESCLIAEGAEEKDRSVVS